MPVEGVANEAEHAAKKGAFQWAPSSCPGDGVLPVRRAASVPVPTQSRRMVQHPRCRRRRPFLLSLVSTTSEVLSYLSQPYPSPPSTITFDGAKPPGLTQRRASFLSGLCLYISAAFTTLLISGIFSITFTLLSSFLHSLPLQTSLTSHFTTTTTTNTTTLYMMSHSTRYQDFDSILYRNSVYIFSPSVTRIHMMILPNIYLIDFFH